MAIKSKDEMPSERSIDLTGPDGNAFVLMGYAKQYGQQLGWDKVKCQELINEMMEGDYEHLLKVFDTAFGEFVTLYR